MDTFDDFMKKTIVTFDNFVEGYKLRKIGIVVNPRAISALVSSPQMNTSRRLAYKLYYYIGLISFLSIFYLIFVSWVYALAAFLWAIVIFYANKKSAISFIAERMLENEEFFHFCLSNKLACLEKNGHALLYKDGKVLDYGLFDEPEKESQSTQ
jgi:hypothetical protein